MDNLNVKGRIFDIQKFSTHDGPGIRTIVFLKGCALRCKWCCNPESQSFETETMIQNSKEKLMGKDVTVEEVMDIVMQDYRYYRHSGGGITLSGGECMLQPDFSKALLEEAKASGITTAVETTSFTKYEIIEKLLPYIDYYMMDIKHINSQKHKEFTGQPNEIILANARTLAKTAKNFTVRVPVIPTFNATDEEISDIAEFTASLGNNMELHLLPYHRLGQDKYTGLNRPYLLKEILPPDEKQMEHFAQIVESKGVKCLIGG